MSYVVVSSHRGMALDAGRNEAYARALAAAITADSVVLDLGAGTGVHGLMAARLGARRVYLVEPEDIIALAEENVRANGLQDVVRCIQGRIEDVTLPEPVDVIVSVLTGNFLLTEDLLPVLFHARDRFLRPGGHLIPGAATMEVVPVTAAALHELEIASWSRPQHGVDLGAARPYAANTLFYRTEGFEALTELADPVLVNSIDFYKSQYEPLNSTVECIVTRPGICHGWLGWFSAKLGDTWFSTSPRAPRSHWSLAFLPLDPPMPLELGERVGFQLARAPLRRLALDDEGEGRSAAAFDAGGGADEGLDAAQGGARLPAGAVGRRPRRRSRAGPVRRRAHHDRDRPVAAGLPTGSIPHPVRSAQVRADRRQAARMSDEPGEMIDHKRYLLAPAAVFKPSGDEALILNLHDETMFALNATGARIVALAVEGKEGGAIVRVLAEEYHSSVEEISRAVGGLLDELVARGLLLQVADKVASEQ